MRIYIVTTEAEGVPLIYHRGLYIQGAEVVYHNTPTKTNDLGGNLVVDSVDEFLNGRRIVGAERVDGIDLLHVRNQYEAHREKIFDVVEWNCETWIETATRGSKRETQVWAWLLATFLLIVVGYIMFFR